ncbi:MAG: glycosyltransferase family 2 protein [Nitrospirae bacterium]|nr:glycosyltransferase family 2 protein [Nitrospirota bacterium]
MSSNSQPLVSIVTPVYNGEEYLTECIESVLSQTYENWEYLIVNNCSKDRTLEIAEGYAKRDDRIRIHNNEKLLNALDNFNHALSLISPDSKYCKELHADDWLFPECLSEMVKVAEANPSVGIVGSYALKNTKIIMDGLPYQTTVIKGRDLCGSTLLGVPQVLGSPSSHLIRSDIIRNSKAFYNGSHLYADHDAYFRVLQNHDFGFAHKVLTFWRVHDEQRSSAANRLNTYLLSEIYLTVKYGPVCLSSEAYKKRINEYINYYHKFLAKSRFLFQDKEFRDYHGKFLKEIGMPLNLVKLIRFSLLELADILLNPKNTIEKIVAKFIKKSK